MNVGDTYELRLREADGTISVDAPVTVLGFCESDRHPCVRVERSDGELSWVSADELCELVL